MSQIYVVVIVDKCVHIKIMFTSVYPDPHTLMDIFSDVHPDTGKGDCKITTIVIKLT